VSYKRTTGDGIIKKCCVAKYSAADRDDTHLTETTKRKIISLNDNFKLRSPHNGNYLSNLAIRSIYYNLKQISNSHGIFRVFQKLLTMDMLNWADQLKQKVMICELYLYTVVLWNIKFLRNP